MQGGEYCSGLQVVTAGSHEAVVQLLLEKNVDINMEGGEYISALQMASAHSHKVVMQLLLVPGEGCGHQHTVRILW